jgi:hypothetical protein
MFVSINIYFRPYEFLAVYQCVACTSFMPRPDLVYIWKLNRERK